MRRFGVHEFDWQPDLADHRDYLPRHPAVKSLLRKAKFRTTRALELPSSVDWREYCGPVEDQQDLATSTAHSCVALVQHFERRSSGRLLRLSRLFAHYAAARFMPGAPGQGVSIRAMLKSMVHCGVPPEKHWPYEPSRLSAEPDAFAYSFQRYFQAVRYVRLDSRDSTGDEVLEQLRTFLAAGLPCVFGFPVCSSVGNDAEIPYPTVSDAILGGQAVTAVGYDDKLRIRSHKGALIVRNSWGTGWGDGGYGWLPYAYVRDHLALDFWTLLKPAWLRSGEFELI